MEINNKTVYKIYKSLPEDNKELVKGLIGLDNITKLEEEFENDPEFRITNFTDAYYNLGADHYLCREWSNINDDICDVDTRAYVRLKIICKALNEEWFPTTENEKYMPCFRLGDENFLIGTKSIKINSNNFFYWVDPEMYDDAVVNYNLCLKSKELARYCGEQFIDIWFDYYNIV